MSAAQLHLALNHLPVVGSLVATILLAITAIRRPAGEASLYGYIALIVVALAAISSYITGNAAADQVYKLPGVTGPHLDAHQLAAGITGIVSILVALLAAIPLVFPALAARRPVAIAFLIASVGINVLYLWVAHAGGLIRHTELS